MTSGCCRRPRGAGISKLFSARTNSCSSSDMKHKSPQPLTRRDALCRMGNGFGMLAFASLVGESIARAAGPALSGVEGQEGTLDPRKLDHPARAKRVIF